MAHLEQTLKELGFLPVPQLNKQQEERKKELQQKLIAAEGAPRVNPEPEPQFFHVNGKTFALCSVASRWFKDGIVDLSSHGFCDVNAQMHDIMQKVR